MTQGLIRSVANSMLKFSGKRVTGKYRTVHYNVKLAENLFFQYLFPNRSRVCADVKLQNVFMLAQMEVFFNIGN